jgi:hypothetical protein
VKTFLNIRVQLGISSVTEELKLHTSIEELHNVYTSPSIIRTIKSRWMRWAGYVARMGREEIHIGYWWESRKEGDHWEDQGVGGWTILKWILER